MNTKLALIVKLIVIVISFALIYPIQKYIDKNHPLEENVESVLYLSSGSSVKRLSCGFEGTLADLYWLRSVQYFGRQILSQDQEVNHQLEGSVDYRLLYPLLDITTTLDPQHIEAYNFGALLLPSYNYAQAEALLEKGIKNNPQTWQLYQSLATVYWKQRKYPQASEAFSKGGDMPNAPKWMKILSGVMLTQTGRRETACQMYSLYYEEAAKNNDQLTREQMEAQIRRIQTFDELDYINKTIQAYQQKTGKCPQSVPEIVSLIPANNEAKGSCGQFIEVKLNEKGEIISPLGETYPFIFEKDKCKVKSLFEIKEP